MLLLIIPSRLSHDQQQNHDDNLHHYRQQHHHYHYHCLLLILLLLLLPLLHSSSSSSSSSSFLLLLLLLPNSAPTIYSCPRLSIICYHLLSATFHYCTDSANTRCSMWTNPCPRGRRDPPSEEKLSRTMSCPQDRTTTCANLAARHALQKTSAGSHCDALLIFCSWLLHLASCGHPVRSEVIPMESDTSPNTRL